MEKDTKIEIKRPVRKSGNKDTKRKISYKVLKKPGNFVLVFAIAYIMLIILSIIGRVSTLEYTSTTEVSFGAVMGEFTMPFIMAALLVVTCIVYYKNKIYGATLEFAVGCSMVMDVIISVVTSGFDILALITTLIIPGILITHSIIFFKSIKKENKKSA